jgi:hypothetical protein|tara:strand:- start:4982 stop:5596 length:615 start_codon:yes stop_codon:yes gene_type:complete
MIICQFRYNLSKFGILCFCYIFSTNGIADDFNEDYKQPNRGLKAAQFMPINKPNIRIKIPQFKDGKLDCVIRAEKMTRITEDDIDLKGMNMDFYDDSNKEMRVYFKSATYSLMRNKIKSKEVTKVSRPNFFTLTGESIEFDVDKRQGRMIGKVRMVLHGSDKLVRSSDGEDLYIGASKPYRFPVLSAVRLMSEAIQKGKENSEK